jgi:hypothetical protein
MRLNGKQCGLFVLFVFLIIARYVDLNHVHIGFDFKTVVFFHYTFQMASLLVDGYAGLVSGENVIAALENG